MGCRYRERIVTFLVMVVNSVLDLPVLPFLWFYNQLCHSKYEDIKMLSLFSFRLEYDGISLRYGCEKDEGEKAKMK